MRAGSTLWQPIRSEVVERRGREPTVLDVPHEFPEIAESVGTLDRRSR
jgi:hypothetical protein